VKFWDYVNVIQVLHLSLCNCQWDGFCWYMIYAAAAAYLVLCGTQIGVNWENKGHLRYWC